MTSTRRGRPPHPDVLTPAEWRVAEGVREGRTYAEIADDLGVSVNTVRYHVANIFAKLGLTSRRELEAWDGQPRRRREWALAVAALGLRGAAIGVAGVAFVAVVAVTFAVLLGDRPAEELPSSLELPGMAGFATFTPAELSALGFIDTGPLLHSTDGKAFASLVRAGFTVARVPSGNVAVADGPWVQGEWSPRMVSTDWTWFGARNRALRVLVSVTRDGHGLWDTVLCRAIASGSVHAVSVDWRDVQPESLVDTLDGAEVLLGACDEDGHARLSVIDADGHLWVQARPIIAQVIVGATGEALDLSAMEEVGRWHRAGEPVSYGTSCMGSEPCRASSNALGAATSPFDGEIACDTAPEGEDRLLLRSGRWSIELRPHIAPGRFQCPPGLRSAGWQRISEGDRLPSRAGTWVWWITRAWDAEGNLVDAVIADDGRLFLGDAGARFSCPPCLAGN